MQYREILPTPPLARFVECFWILESNGRPSSNQPERILPDGCTEIILNFRAPFRELRAHGKEDRQPMNFLVGQMTQPMVIAPTGPVEVIGIRFHPGGTLPFFRLPLHEVTNQVVELGALSSRLERDLIRSVEATPHIPARISALEQVMVEQLRDCAHDSWVIGLAAEIVNQAGQVSVDKLAERAGISNRQLERRFLHEVGIGPKLLSRILRFQQVFRAIDRDDPQWAATATQCGYYDQAHLIRDFQQFAQQTPTRVLAQSTQLTESFTRKHRVSDFSNTRVKNFA